MGKNSKAQDAEMKRRYMEARRTEELEKQRKQNRLMWQIIIGVFAIVLLVAIVSIAVSLGEKNNQEEETFTAPAMSELDFTEIDIANTTVTEEVTDYVRLNISYTDKNGVEQTGDVIIRLYANVAPETVANFQKLVKSDFYDGLTFHRIIEDFMIQGGDPDGDGSGDAGTTLKGEFSSNGFTNNLKHERGVVSMARGESPNSASCQFFIVQGEASHLDGDYASFGYVVYGMDTVDAIAQTELVIKTETVPSSPVNPVTINYATFVSMRTEEDTTTAP